NARDEARLDRQLGGGKRERLLGGLHRDAVDLENHAAGLDPRHPQFRRTLAGAHADFGGLLRHRQVRKHADPDAAGALHVTGQRAARGFDLTGGYALGRHRLQAELTERQRRTRSRNAVDTALMRLPELRFLWLHHGFKPSNLLLMSHAASRRGRVVSPSAIFLSWAIGSCSRISPLKIQTLTPQGPNVVNAVATPESMSARSVCRGTRPSRYHSMRAISAPPRRPEQLMRMPSAPRRIADCTAR